MGKTTLPSRYFLCDDVFQRETELIFNRAWLAVAHATGLQQAGDFLHTTLEGWDLLLVHAGDRVRCFHNTCRHRGAQLVNSDCGSLGNRHLVCPYHAWTYNREGKLVAAPNMLDADGFDPAQHGLHEVACASWLGFWMVSLDSEHSMVSGEYEQLASRLAPWQLSSLVRVAAHEYDVAANWKLIMQNYSECYHCPAVHPALNRLTSYRSASNDLVSGPFLGGPMELNHACETMSTDGKRVGLPMATLDANQRRRVYYYVLFPNLLVSLHPDYVMAHRVHREAVDRTRVICEFYFSPDSLENREFSPERATHFWDEVNRQDWHVCELSQRGISSPAYQPGPYSPMEQMLVAFDDHYLQTLGDQ